MNRSKPPGLRALRLASPLKITWHCCGCQLEQPGTTPRTYIAEGDDPYHYGHVFCPGCAREHGAPDEKSYGYWSLGGLTCG